MKVFTSNTQKTGKLGEDIAVSFLVKHGFSILERNFTCKAGELDIVCQKSSRIHFIEVKSGSVHHNPVFGDQYNPFDNVSREKLRKFGNTVQYWLLQRAKYIDSKWQIDGIAVYLDSITRTAKVLFLENINIS